MKTVAVLIMLLYTGLFRPEASVDRPEKILFSVCYGPDKPVVVYRLNQNPDGTLNDAQPLKASGMEQQDMQGRYRIQSRWIADNEFELRLANYEKMPIYLWKPASSADFNLYVKVGEERFLLKQISLKINRGSRRFPASDYLVLRTRLNN